MVQLIYDVISEIVSYLPLTQVTFAAKILGSSARDIKSIHNARLSYHKVFGELVPDVDALIRCMLSNNCWLFGSRAVEYFIPGSCLNGSDWNFLTDNFQHTVRMRTALAQLGTIWDKYDFENFPLDRVTGLITIVGSIVYRGKISVITITTCDASRLKFAANSAKDTRESLSISVMIATIAATHSTPVQCFITGELAVHLDEKSSRAGKLIKNTFLTGVDYTRGKQEVIPRRQMTHGTANPKHLDRCRVCCDSSGKDTVISQELLVNYMKMYNKMNKNAHQLEGRNLSLAISDWIISKKYDMEILPKDTDKFYKKSILRHMIERCSRRCSCQQCFTQIEYQKYCDRGYSNVVDSCYRKLPFIAGFDDDKDKGCEINYIKELEGAVCFILVNESDKINYCKAKAKSQLIGDICIYKELRLPIFRAH